MSPLFSFRGPGALARHIAGAVFVVVLLSAGAPGQDWPGKTRDFHGHVRHDFSVDGRSCYVVRPKHPAPGNPWVWRARFPSYHKGADLILLARGFHIAHLNTNGMLGSPRAMQHWDAFYRFVVQRGLAKRVALHGVSRGGLFVYGFASRYPARVACLYADTPVCDLRSWPGGRGKGLGHERTWEAMLKEYGWTESQALAYSGHPIDILAPIARAKIPVLHIVSLTDRVVPPDENTFVLADRYRKLGGRIDIMRVEKGTAKSNGHHFAHPDFLRVADFIERHASALPDSPAERGEKGGGSDSFRLRGSLRNSRVVFESTKKGRVAFLGGSITQNPGWRDMTKAYLRQRFPETEFEFVDAGISSTGSTAGAFRLTRDVLSRGKVDLLFEEAAVNDLHNKRADAEITRGMEGIVRQARAANPAMDLVIMHFVDPRHMAAYRAGRTPRVIEIQEAVAAHYQISTLHLAREVTERIDAGQFSWKKDFRNLHPSPFGQRLYAAAMRRMFTTAWDRTLVEKTVEPYPKLPAAMDPFSYGGAGMIAAGPKIESAGFVFDEKCDPRLDGVGGGVRAGFVDVPMLVAKKPGAVMNYAFRGRGIGLFLAAGPDAGVVDYRIDEGPWKSRDLFTNWSRGLHLPWVLLLEAELDGGAHRLTLRMSEKKNARSKGHACRILYLVVNQ